MRYDIGNYTFWAWKFSEIWEYSIGALGYGDAIVFSVCFMWWEAGIKWRRDKRCER